MIYLDGHTDTVQALRDDWREKTGGGLDPYDGLRRREAKVDRAFLRGELGYLPPDADWPHLVFGRGSADQLGGVVCQVVASKVLMELKGPGALRGVIVRSYATAAEEDNDGGGPMHLVMRRGVPHRDARAGPRRGDPHRGHRRRAQGCARASTAASAAACRSRWRSSARAATAPCPGRGGTRSSSAARIVAEAARRYEAREGFLDHPFLGHGTRTASWAKLDTPSDCAVPERFTFRFDRRLTIGETPEQAVRDVEALDAVGKAARAAGLTVDVSVPHYAEKTWTGLRPTTRRSTPAG